MACCVIAAFLFAQFMAMLRRWAVFWGLASVPVGETADTVFTRLSGWVARAEVRRALAALVLVELGVVGTGLYFGHGAHLVRVAQHYEGAVRARGADYARLCSEAYRRATRLDTVATLPVAR